MGLVILPFLLINIVFLFWGGIHILKALSNKQITISHLLAGIAISILIYGILFLDYKLSDTAYALGTWFMFPFFMVSVPFFIGLCAITLKGKIPQFVSSACMFSVILSGIFIIVFQKYTFNIIDFLGIEKHY